MTELVGNGQGWQILHGDCLEAMRGMPGESFDLIFTSPPYNLRNSTGGGMSAASAPTSKWKASDLRIGYDSNDDNMPWDEYVAWQKELLSEMWRLLSPTGAIYYNHKPRVRDGLLVTPLDYNPGLPVRQIVIWNRSTGFNFNVSFYRSCHEWVVIFAKPAFRLSSQGASGVGDVWNVAPDSNNPHPAPFPVELPLRALTSTTGRRVLDPFCGSGSTGVACLMTGKDFTGIDNSRRYCEQACVRLRRSEGLGYTRSMFDTAATG